MESISKISIGEVVQRMRAAEREAANLRNENASERAALTSLVNDAQQAERQASDDLDLISELCDALRRERDLYRKTLAGCNCDAVKSLDGTGWAVRRPGPDAETIAAVFTAAIGGRPMA